MFKALVSTTLALVLAFGLMIFPTKVDAAGYCDFYNYNGTYWEDFETINGANGNALKFEQHFQDGRIYGKLLAFEAVLPLVGYYDGVTGSGTVYVVVNRPGTNVEMIRWELTILPNGSIMRGTENWGGRVRAISFAMRTDIAGMSSSPIRNYSHCYPTPGSTVPPPPVSSPPTAANTCVLLGDYRSLTSQNSGLSITEQSTNGQFLGTLTDRTGEILSTQVRGTIRHYGADATEFNHWEVNATAYRSDGAEYLKLGMNASTRCSEGMHGFWFKPNGTKGALSFVRL